MKDEEVKIEEIEVSHWNTSWSVITNGPVYM